MMVTCDKLDVRMPQKYIVLQLIVAKCCIIQGDRSKKVGIVDSEYVVHQGIQSLGGPSAKKVSL